MQSRTPESDDADLRRTSDRVERLLEEIRSQTSPPVWRHVDELVHRLLELYGAGLGRFVDIALEAGATRERLAADQLIGSLLLLHGMHPFSAEERVQRALARLAPFFEAQALSVTLESLDAEGLVHIRVTGADDGRTRQIGAIRTTVRQAIEEAAPEVVRVEIEGLPSSEAPALVQLRARPEAVEAAT